MIMDTEQCNFISLERGSALIEVPVRGPVLKVAVQTSYIYISDKIDGF